jgi:hypothetical protein
MIGLLMLTAIPTVTGVAQGVSQQRAQNAADAGTAAAADDNKRMAKFYLHARCEAGSERARREVQGRRVVLRDNKVRYIIFNNTRFTYRVSW